MGNWYPGDYKKNKTVKEVTHVPFDPRTRGRKSNEFSNPPSHSTRESGLIVPRLYFRPVLGLSQREWFPIPYYHANDNNAYCLTLQFRDGPLEKLWGGRGIFELQEFFFVIKFFAWILFRPLLEYFLGLIGVHEFFFI